MPLRYVLQIFVVVLFAGIGASGFAELRIDITQGNMRPLPIAIPNFLEAEGATQSFGKKVTTVISANLARSGLFDVLDPKSFIQTLRDIETPPRFGDWRVINSEILVSGKITALPEEKIQVAFRLWDVLSEKSMLGMAFTTERQNWRRVSHIITDAIYKRLTGESGYFDSRIVYIAESGPKKNRIKRLAVMDQDGANHRFLSDGRSLVLTPRFSPTRQEITYLSYFNNTPRVYLFNIETGQHEMLGTFKGMTFAPRFSADGNAMLMSYADAGNSDIYMMDLQTRRPKRLTTHPAIDTSPSASPDNARIVFNSDRGGSPQLYVMNADGSDVNRISFSQGRYATPVWSPRGDLIAFTRQMRGRFYIGVMRPDGTGERLLTESFLDEGPTWAPNGRVLMFFRQEPGENGQVRLFSIDLTGYNLREVITPGDSSDPAWSPLNQ